jgi:hypothetical protein
MPRRHAGTFGGPIIKNSLNDRHQEGKRLATTRLGKRDHIPTREYLRNNLGLH